MNRGKSAQEIQDEIFRKMSTSDKLKLTSNISTLVLNLYRIAKRDRSRFQALCDYFASELQSVKKEFPFEKTDEVESIIKTKI